MIVHKHTSSKKNIEIEEVILHILYAKYCHGYELLIFVTLSIERKLYLIKNTFNYVYASNRVKKVQETHV